MESSRCCQRCQKRTIVQDDDTGNSVCRSCGVVQDYDNFQAHLGGITGPVGTYVRLGTSGTGNDYNYKETKIYQAQKLIEDLMFRLSFSASKSDKVKQYVVKITEGEYGQGNWFPVLVGACAYIVMRQDSTSLTILEVANKVGCDIYELGRMVYRVVEFLDLKLPEFGIADSFERYVRNNPRFCKVSEDIVGRMLKQGVFLVQCLVKWYVTTGRRPLPVVAAVLAFVAELNQINVKIEDVAKDLQVAVFTCNLRYKELLERLVKVARALPWGEDVTIKNITKHAPFVIQYMELKSMSKKCDIRRSFEDIVGFDLDYMIDDCLSKENTYGFDINGAENDTQYFQVERSPSPSSESPNRFQISEECLAMIYSKIQNEASALKIRESRDNNNNGRKRRRKYDILSCTDWWKGESEMSKKLLVKQIVEKDVGLSTATPPSFDRGCLAYERRKEKINAAKYRIHQTMYPSDPGTVDEIKHVNTGKKRRMKTKVDVDWEDFLIETLLLHQVTEEEIEKGYYKTLMDLHVFNY